MYHKLTCDLFIILTFAPEKYEKIWLELHFARGHGRIGLPPKVNELVEKLKREHSEAILSLDFPIFTPLTIGEVEKYVLSDNIYET